MAFNAVLAVFSTFFGILAIWFSYKLSKETGGEKYWVFFLVAAISFSVAHFSSKGFFINYSSETLFLIQELGEIVGSFSLAYAAYGLYSSMKKIRQKIGSELGE